MSQLGHFIGPGQPGAPFRAIGGPIRAVGHPKKKKKKTPLLSLLLELKGVSGKFFNSNCSRLIQPSKVRSRSMKSLRMQI